MTVAQVQITFLLAFIPELCALNNICCF